VENLADNGVAAESQGSPLPRKSRKNTVRIRISLLIILFLGLIVRFSYISTLTANPQTLIGAYSSDVYDQFRFMELAKEFTGGNWMGSTVTKYSPVYSYLIAVLFRVFEEDLFIVFAFQSLLGILSVFALYKTAVLLFENKNIGLIAALIGSLYGPFVFYEGTLLRASVIVTCNLGGFYFLLAALKQAKTKYYFLSGLLIGLSLILRPNILPLVVVPCIFLNSRASLKQKTVFSLLFLTGIVMLVTPLTIRNRLIGRDTLVSHQGPSTFWIGNTPDATGVGLYRSPLRAKFAEEAQGSVLKTAAIFVREIKKDPQAYIRIYITKSLMYLNGYEIPANLSYDLAREDSLALKLCVLGFGIVSPLALLGIVLSFKSSRHIRLLLLFLLALSFSSILFHIQGRYRLPAVPFFIVFAAYAVHWTATRVPQLDHKSLMKTGILFTFFLALTIPQRSLTNFFFGAPIPHSYYQNQGISYYLLYKSKKASASPSAEEQKDRQQKVLLYIDKALAAVSPRNINDQIMYLVFKGNFLAEIGEKDKARASFQKAFTLDPAGKETIQSYIDQKEMFLPDLKGALPF